MKVLFNLLFICTFALLSACSQFAERTPASADEFENAFLFPSTTIGDVDYQEFIKNHVEIPDGGFDSSEGFDKREISFVPTNALPNNAAYKIDMDVDQSTGKLIFKIFHTPNAFKDDVASLALTDFMWKMLNGVFVPAQAIFELYYNAKSGDPIAIDTFLKIRENANDSVVASSYPNITQSEAFQNYVKKPSAFREQLKDDIKALTVARNAARTQRKSILDALDKAPEGKQFRNLMAKNDLKGAADVVRKYLPWESMAAFETKFWKTFLDVLENPVPLDQRVFIYRGLAGDYIHKAIVNGTELTTEEAILQGKAFIMSAGMVKNQGSWNRRLRSLETMNKKFMGKYNGSDEYSQAARISTMFYNHSLNPDGSPFISFSPKFEVASSFGYDRISAYLLDPRLIIFNHASEYQGEIEYLTMLSTSPKDMVGIADISLMPSGSGDVERKAYLDRKLEEKIVKEFGEDKKDEILTKIKKNSYNFFKGAQNHFAEIAGANPAAENKLFYKKLIENHPNAPLPSLSSEGDLQCTEIIQLFWTTH